MNKFFFYPRVANGRDTDTRVPLTLSRSTLQFLFLLFLPFLSLSSSCTRIGAYDNFRDDWVLVSRERKSTFWKITCKDLYVSKCVFIFFYINIRRCCIFEKGKNLFTIIKYTKSIKNLRILPTTSIEEMEE